MIFFVFLFIFSCINAAPINSNPLVLSALILGSGKPRQSKRTTSFPTVLLAKPLNDDEAQYFKLEVSENNLISKGGARCNSIQRGIRESRTVTSYAKSCRAAELGEDGQDAESGKCQEVSRRTRKLG
jgi:hypothetical protein